MTLSGDAAELYELTMAAALSVHADVKQSMEGMKTTYDHRLGSPQHAKAWESVKRGYERAADVHRRLLELGRQLKALEGHATLSEVECALFSYVRDDAALQLPPLDFV